MQPSTKLGLIAGRYEVIAQIRQSYMSTVYLGVDSLTCMNVIIKVLNTHPNFIGDEHEENIARFYLEASIYRELVHPNVVKLIDRCTTSQGHLCMIMEFISGPTLDTITRHANKYLIGSRLSLLQQLCSVVDFAHSRGIWHRDLKPSNVLIMPDWTVKLIDFGIAKTRGNPNLTRKGCMLTPDYSSPEQINESKDLDQLSDLFVLAILAYVVITGHHPFQDKGDKGSSTNSNIRLGNRFYAPNETTLPLHLDKWRKLFAKALNPQPKLRFSSADHFYEDLLACFKLDRKRDINTKGHFRYPSYRLTCLDEMALARQISWDLFCRDVAKGL